MERRLSNEIKLSYHVFVTCCFHVVAMYAAVG